MPTSGRTIGKKPVYLLRTNRESGGGRIIDARNKIIQKNRSKIIDARDKLVQIAKHSGDARLKIMRKMNTKQRGQSTSNPHIANTRNNAPVPVGNGRSYMGVQMKKSRLSNYTTDRRRPAPAYRNAAANDHMDIDDYLPASISLRRTVQNDIAYSKMPPLPSFPRTINSDHAGAGYRLRRNSPPIHSQAAVNLWNSDPFDCYEVPIGRPADVSEPKNLHRHIRNINTDMMPRKGILR